MPDLTDPEVREALSDRDDYLGEAARNEEQRNGGDTEEDTDTGGDSGGDNLVEPGSGKVVTEAPDGETTTVGQVETPDEAATTGDTTSQDNESFNPSEEAEETFEGAADEPDVVKEKINEQGEVVNRETASTRRGANQLTDTGMQPPENNEEFPTIDPEAPRSVRQRQRTRQRAFVERDEAQQTGEDAQFQREILENRLETGNVRDEEAVRSRIDQLEQVEQEAESFETEAGDFLDRYDSRQQQPRDPLSTEVQEDPALQPLQETQREINENQRIEQELRQEARENPAVPMLAQRLREARNTPTQEERRQQDPLPFNPGANLIPGREDEIQEIRETVANEEDVSFEEVSRFANRTEEAGLSSGEISTLTGESASEFISSGTENILQPEDNPAIGFIGEGFAGLSSAGSELYNTFTTEDSFDLEEARTVTPEEKDQFTQVAGETISQIPAVPAQIQRRLGQAEQLSSGELTGEEAAAAAGTAASQQIEFAQENPGQFGTALGTGFAALGPTGTSGFRRATRSSVDAGTRRASSAAETVQNQLTPGGFEETTFRDFLAGDLGRRPMTPDEIADTFDEGDVLMGRNVPDVRESRPTTARSRTEFLRDYGLPRNTDPENFAGQMFEPEPGLTGRIRNALGNRRKGSAQLVNPVQKVKDTVDDFDTTGRDISISDRVDRMRDRARTPERSRNRRRTDTDNERGFDRPRRDTDTDSGTDITGIAGAGLGLGVGQDTGVDELFDNPFDTDQDVDQDQEIFQQETPGFERPRNQFDTPGGFWPRTSETDFIRQRETEEPRRRRRRDRDFDFDLGDDDSFVFQDSVEEQNADADLGAGFTESLTAQLFSIEASEDFQEEDFVGTGVGIRPLVDNDNEQL